MANPKSEVLESQPKRCCGPVWMCARVLRVFGQLARVASHESEDLRCGLNASW